MLLVPFPDHLLITYILSSTLLGMLSGIRLVTFDALHTIIKPRLPIYVQYSQAFEPYLGVLSPDAIRASFKSALRDVQKEHPSYRQGVETWWRDVIRRTALGAGGNKKALDANLAPIVDSLMKRFSSGEGYRAFHDAIPTIKQLSTMGIRTAVVSNGDSRLRSVLQDLDFPHIQDSILLSAEEGVEKPSQAIFMQALDLVNSNRNELQPIRPKECLHVGDELECDYHGATAAGFNALLIRRPGPLGEGEQKEANEDLRDVQCIGSLDEIPRRLLREAENECKLQAGEFVRRTLPKGRHRSGVRANFRPASKFPPAKVLIGLPHLPVLHHIVRQPTNLEYRRIDITNMPF
ncbi:hypothetical protein D9619_001896 [Psilocybe cf. subviscida]|uniref:Uncharacterized protein n=1 Tax=Psilocybe cf. subviscida TaxID=2480587 RepID=A0A8H5F3Q9_9AGAR|nr:hypothetical protein D9619_001896 [Psilocybe cf. subviscida]